jgi:hypothetical protein
MRDIALANGDIALNNNDLIIVDDPKDHLMRSLATPQGFLRQVTSIDGVLTTIDSTYGNAIYSMLSEALTPSLLNDMQMAINDAAKGAAKNITLTFTDPSTVNITLETSDGLIEFTATS